MIEVGDFIRTDNGIIAQVINPNYYMEVYIECKEGLIIRDNIVKHSKDIIDLIEVGDYVNGSEVVIVYDYDEDGNDRDGIGICEVDDDYAYYTYLENINIYSIVTKEQFKNMEYKIEKER